jgi:hypothetical protein
MTQRFTPTPEQLADILAKHLAWWRSEPEGSRAYLRGAYLRGAYLSGADLSDCLMAWQSHALIAERLRRAAGEDAYKRLAAGYVLVSEDWCWDELMDNVPPQVADLLPWALSEMRRWVKDGDDAPEILLAAPVVVEEATS